MSHSYATTRWTQTVTIEPFLQVRHVTTMSTQAHTSHIEYKPLQEHDYKEKIKNNDVHNSPSSLFSLFLFSNNNFYTIFTRTLLILYYDTTVH